MQWIRILCNSISFRRTWGLLAFLLAGIMLLPTDIYSNQAHTYGLLFVILGVILIPLSAVLLFFGIRNDIRRRKE